MLSGLDGFAADVIVHEDGQLCCRGCEHCVAPEDMDLLAIRRIEGASDPGDEAAVLGLRCAGCGDLGVAIVRYGPEAGPGDEAVLKAVADRRATG